MKRVQLFFALLLFALPAAAQTSAVAPVARASNEVVVPTGPPIVPTTAHSVTLTWNVPSDAIATSTYNVYRITATCPTTPLTSASAALTAGFAKLNSAPLTATTDVDSSVTPGTYCYFVTQVQGGLESPPSNNVVGAISPYAPTVVGTSQ